MGPSNSNSSRQLRLGAEVSPETGAKVAFSSEHSHTIEAHLGVTHPGAPQDQSMCILSNQTLTLAYNMNIFMSNIHLKL